MKMFILSVFALVLSTTSYAHPGHGGHLSFAGGKIHAHLAWEKGPDGNGGESIMLLEWHDGDTHALIEPGLPFGVSLWMPSMGHGSSPTQIQPVIDDHGQPVLGTYRVGKMHFLMPGDWDVRVTLSDREGKTETQVWSISVDGDDHGGHHH